MGNSITQKEKNLKKYQNFFCLSEIMGYNIVNREIFLNNLNLYLRGMNRDDTHNERAGRDTEKFY